jgi:murein DD-endopeptidase MepM/ murein hydrolase activator NlpD
MSLTYLSPSNLKRVKGLAGQRVHAALSTSADVTEPITCRVQLVEQIPGEDTDWAHRLWETEVEPERVYSFVTVGGCPAEDGMVVGSTTPSLVLASATPIAAVSWRLRNDGSELDRGGPSTVEIAAGGLAATITPKNELRRSGERRRYELRPGEFKPPFAWRSGWYDTRTYNLPSIGKHSPYAVDFNRPGDEGDPVKAAAQGTVNRYDAALGVLDLEHRGGWVTHYGHMQDIPARLREAGAPVAALERIGRIGAVGTTAPHLHHQHLRHGAPHKMRFDGVDMDASLKDPPFGQVVFGQKVRGPKVPRGVSRAAYRVAVKRPGDGRWSGFGRLGFVVGEEGSEPCSSVAEGSGHTVWFVDAEYDGQELLPGTYLLRYRCRDGAGNQTPWAYDHVRVVGN